MKKSAFIAFFMMAYLVTTGAWATVLARHNSIPTRWAANVNESNVHQEYPRPQMVRQQWSNLNGSWDYALVAKNAPAPANYDGKILVPFAIESTLSGVEKTVGPDKQLWYRRFFNVPQQWQSKRLLLHFGGVDWRAEVFLNGQRVGEHKGGFTPFTFDISPFLRSDGAQELVVAVYDPGDEGAQPVGKQANSPDGIYYTTVTGIWQTVWLEPVANQAIESLQVTPDIDRATVAISVNGQNLAGVTVTATAFADGAQIAVGESVASAPLTLTIPNQMLWSPDQPFLYGLQLELRSGNQVIDHVNSYFAMRKISMGKDPVGTNRLLLNNKPLFQFGPLDQGWWPDGLYTAPTDEAMLFDIQQTKALGFNMIRKHIKVEPLRWYYYCDRLGMLVWQDMPSGHRNGTFNDESKAQFEKEYSEIIATLYSFPSIVMWVPFNESWGQFDTERIVAHTRQLDPTRLINNASGWVDKMVGDVYDIHSYPGPEMVQIEQDRAIVLGEFGGLGLPIDGHLWQNKHNWGYRTYHTRKELEENYLRLVEGLKPLIRYGLSAAVYTQTTDVEGEINGLMTYDRAEVKLNEQNVRRLHESLYHLDYKTVKTLLPTSEQAGQAWFYTTQDPGAGWSAPDYDHSRWSEGLGGFGSVGTLGAVVRTPWTTDRIWLRRVIDLPALDEDIFVKLHHDENVTVYVNGYKILELDGFTKNYIYVPIDPSYKKYFKPGRNVIAVEVLQTVGGQYIDLGFESFVPTSH